MKLTFCLQIKIKVFCKITVSFWVCVTRNAQSTQNNRFTISLQYVNVKENVKDEADFLLTDKRWRFLQSDSVILCVCGRHPILPKITSLLLVSKWVIFCMQISMKASFRLILWFWWKWSSIPKVPKRASLQCLRNISKNKLEMKMTFWMQINISFLQVDFNALGIKVFYKVILSLFMSMI